MIMGFLPRHAGVSGKNAMINPGGGRRLGRAPRPGRPETGAAAAPREVAVNEERVIALVQREAGLDAPGAEGAVRATLSTLAERLLPGEAGTVAGLLPEGIGRWASPRGERETFGADEFLRRTAERSGTDVDSAELRVRAVFYALSRALTAPEFATMVGELPKDYGPLLTGARRPPVEVLPVEEFLRRVADRAWIDLATALTASEAVLETLGERLAGGEVVDLRKELPPELRPAMERGLARTGETARGMSLEEFLATVAVREGVPVEDALEHDRAVFATLRDAFTDKAFADMSSELPAEYLALARP
ncbi:MAG: hypothetical protein JWN54_59 [Mycobacterium sp.]|nr:hypothetical protein [Mycobacterium sp.]